MSGVDGINDEKTVEDSNATAAELAAEDRAWRIQTTQRLIDTQQAVRDGKIHFLESQASLVEELMAISIEPGELVDRKKVSAGVIGLVRTVGMMFSFQRQKELESVAERPISRTDAQVELFRHFAEVFSALTGKAYDAFASEEALAVAMRARGAKGAATVVSRFRHAWDALESFYSTNAQVIWGHARELGGMKLVIGGQRMLGPSAFAGVSKMALYADTQLIPDPIFPFFEGELDLKMKFVEIIRQLYQLLKLTPLVDARLPVPPILVFPSFEKALEKGDVQTQAGIADLVLQTVGHACETAFASLDELREFVHTKQAQFVGSVMTAQLFIPPNVLPGEINDPDAAVRRYLEEVSQYRTAKSVQELAAQPLASILFNGVVERLSPQYHLLENANELSAQPMLIMPAHWHFYRATSNAAAAGLRSKDILSPAAITALHALQQARLSWLSNVPMPALVELLRNQENSVFRKELAEHTKELASAGVDDLDRVVREVCHAIGAMVQKHNRTIGDIEAKYAPKYATTWLTGGAGIWAGVGAMFFPALSVFGPAAPLAAGVAMLGKLAVDKIHESAEIQRARSSLLGVFANVQRH